jgi:hypothetical protein
MQRLIGLALGMMIASVSAAHAREWYLVNQLSRVCEDSRTVMYGRWPPTPLDFQKALIAESRFDKTKIDRDASGKIIVVEVWYISHGKSVLVPYFADKEACDKMAKAEQQNEGTPEELR